MKKIYFLLFIAMMMSEVFAGGIITNTNQSAAYVRTLVRDASLDIDGVYYNPAGLVKLKDGFYFSLNNQTIKQTKEITNSYTYLNNNVYQGNINVPVFPGAYFVYKTGKFAISAGFNPIGGGGGAEFDTGLPSFEIDVSNLIPGLQQIGISSGYNADIYFEGTSVFWGFQAGLTYEINDIISVYAGARYVMAKNTYLGHIRNISVNPIYGSYDGTTFIPATTFFTSLGDAATAGATQATGAATSMQPLIDNQLGNLTLPEAVAGGAIDAATQADLENGLIALGIDPSGLTIAEAQGAYSAAAISLENSAASAYATAEGTGDLEVDAEQTGTGVAPILGANFNLLDSKLNIGMKYEFKTEIELENNTTVDGSGLFPDGAKTPSDMPAMLSIGASYKVLDDLKATCGYHLYFDKDLDWGPEKELDENYYELGVALEYNVTDKIIISGGYLYAASGASVGYNTDMSYSLSSNSVAFGAGFKVTPTFMVNVGFLNTMYDDGEKTTEIYKETYYKDNVIFAIGFDYKLF